jgi:alpha-L-fucosidase
MQISRRKMIKMLGGVVPAIYLSGAKPLHGQTATSQAASSIAPGPFQANWDSLHQYRAPQWFRDAKFGIWAHWTAQCVPEQGDWYARQMYIQGHPHNKYHVEHYGHPSKVGFMEIDRLWSAGNWDPNALMDLYVKAGAKYFVALANHHDNFDCYDSRFHAWNSVNVGPRCDIVGIWATAARERGLKFGVTNHSAHAWHWFQTAYGYDPVGNMAGVRYDAYTLRKEDGKGKWWEGMDPQELYVGPSFVLPDGITSIAEMQAWHDSHDRVWTEQPPPKYPDFANKWFLRCQDLVDSYEPDLLYFDDLELPLLQAGLDIAAHFYNSNIARHGSLQAVLNSKQLEPEHVGTMVLDIERGRADHILADAWQTDTCIGSWHYERSLFEKHRYKTAKTVIAMLVDIVSKNGNLLLNIPLRGDGTIDEDERKVLAGLGSWMPANGEGIFGTRPFSVFGEGPPDVKGSGNFNEKSMRAYTAQDIRFTTRGETLYAFALGWPVDGKIRIKTLAAGSGVYPWQIGGVELLGVGAVGFSRDENALVVNMPDRAPNEFACGFKISRAT